MRSVAGDVHDFNNYCWYLNIGDGVPMVALNYMEHRIHALYPEYAGIAWDFIKHYSRDQKTGAIKYNPHIR